jgi:trimeric autotransporter adhesin
MAIGSIITLAPFSATPSPPPVGFFEFYIQGTTLYLQDSNGVTYPFGSVNFISQLTGDVTAIGPGSAVATVAAIQGSAVSNAAPSDAQLFLWNSGTSKWTPVSMSGDVTITDGGVTSISSTTVTGKLLTGLTTGTNTPIVATNSILVAFENLQAQVSAVSGSGITALTGDVLATGPGSAAAVVVAIQGSAVSNTPPTNAQLFLWNSGTSKWTPVSMSGDVSIVNTGATVVQKIQGTAVNPTGPTDAQFFIYNSTSLQWIPQSLSGDVTSTNAGVLTIQANSVSNAKLAQMTAFTVKANITALTANPTNATLGTVTENVSSVLVLTGWAHATIGSPTIQILQAGATQSGYLSSADWNTFNSTSGAAITALTGDVVATGPGSVAATIQPNVVTNSKLAQAPSDTLKGNNTGVTANVTDLTVSQVNTMLGTITTVGAIDSQSPSANGLVISGNDIYAQSASASNPGMVNTTSQTFAGTKTFSAVIVTDLQSATANPAASGVIRLANGDAIAWRNTGNTADILLQPDANGILQYGGVDLVNISSAQVLTNKTIAAGSNTITGLTNANLSGSAGITGSNIASSTVTNTNLAQMAANTVKANTSGIPANPVDTALGTVTEATSAVLVLTSWADATIGSPTIQVLQSTTSQSGYLSSTDWNTFNSKQPAGSYITSLTGDVTATGPGAAAATVVALQGHSVSSTAPTDAQLLLWVSGTSKWTPESMSGDATIADIGVLTLATVNSNVGTFGSSTAINTITVNAKGLITAVTTNAVIAPAGTLTGTTLASNVVNSSLTSVGTITSGVWNGTPLTAPYMLALPTNDIYVGNGSNQPAAVAMSGDATIVSSGALTLATVNSNVGSFGSSTAIPSFTVNAKGLITAASTNVVIAPAGTLTGTTLAANVVNSSLQNLGTQNATLNMGNNALINADTVEIGTSGASTGGLVVANATNFNAASATGVDYSGGISRFISWGPTTSTYSPMEFLQVTSNSSSNRSPIYVNAAGQVGIGNNTGPSYALDVSGTFAADSHAIFTDGSGDMTLNSMTVNTNIGGSKWEIFGSNGHVSFDNAAITSNGSGVLTVADLIVTASSTTAITVNSTAFIFDSTNNALGIGVQPSTSVMIDGVNTTLASKLVQMTGYGVGSNTGYRGRFARGTSGTPAAVQAGDILNTLSGRGYGTSQFAAASTGVVNVVANETFTNTSNQTYLQFLTTPTGSVTSAESFRVATTGVTLGPQSSSTAIHQINGGLYRTNKTITANYTIDSVTSDDIVFCNHSAAITVTLPTPTSGRTITIVDISGAATTNPITIAQHSTEKIENLAVSKVYQTNYGSLVLTSDSVNWWVVG